MEAGETKMSLLTPFYNLKKLLLTDAPPDITELNDNWDIIDTKLKEAADHAAGTIKHITADERTAWNGKAAGNHNHNGAYAPITHSNNEDIHVTAAQKTTWDGKAPTPTVLYNNASGTQSNFTLSQSAANFTHMRIYYFFSDSGKKITNSLDIINPNGAYPSLMTCQCDANNIYLKIAVLYINGTAVSFHTNANTWISNGGGATIQATTKTIRVTRIEAWN